MTFDERARGEGTVLLTGATGFLGMELIATYLERTEHDVIALIRANDRAHACARMRGVMETLFGSTDAYPGRVTAVPGDIEREGLGLAPADRDMIAQRAQQFVHCAATVSFQTELAESRRINVEGTRRALELAEHCATHGALHGFVHVSTAYVAGTHQGMFGEADLDVGQSFRNPYERSKYEAERLVRDRASRLPAVTIVRPSIIVGESRTGWTPAFNVLYVPVRAFAERRLRVLPARRSAPVDVVPGDHVAAAIAELTPTRDEGLNTYHVVAGDRASTVGELLSLSSLQLRRPPPPVVPPSAYRMARPLIVACGGRRRRAAMRRAAPFLPYYTMAVRYGRDRAARKLDAAGLRPPPLEAYYDRLLRFATDSDWGKRPLPRAQR
jgi:thioester reductase-like protein